MNNFKKLILFVLAVGVFSCTKPAPKATPNIASGTPTTSPKVSPQPASNSAPEIGTVTMPDGTVNKPQVSTKTATAGNPNPKVSNSDLPQRKINPMTGNVEKVNPEFDEKSAEIAEKLKSMGNVDVGDVQIIKAPERPDVPKLNDAEKEQLYNKSIKKQMGTILKIVSQQYRMGKLTQRLTRTPSGLEYLTVTKGKGRQAIDGSFVAFKSMGSTLDGEVFESNFEKDRAFRVKIGTNALIPGLEEAVKTMRAGEQAIFFIPPALAYGNRGRIGVPPNAMVVYSLNLESVH